MVALHLPRYKSGEDQMRQKCSSRKIFFKSFQMFRILRRSNARSSSFCITQPGHSYSSMGKEERMWISARRKNNSRDVWLLSEIHSKIICLAETRRSSSVLQEFVVIWCHLEYDVVYGAQSYKGVKVLMQAM